MTTTTAFILGAISAIVVFMGIPLLIGLAIRWLCWDEITPELDAATGLDRWTELVCPECGKHISGPRTTATSHPTRTFEFCQQCQRAQQHTPSTIVHTVHH